MEYGEIAIKIKSELERARKKHPVWPEDIVHQVAIMVEEAGETLKAANDYKYNGVPWEEIKIRIIKEAVQTGAMVVRLLENIPEKEWEPEPLVRNLKKKIEIWMER